jgi:hypothetical protein
MPAKKRKPSADLYQLKITLARSKPPIWRRILVPANCSLEDLHYAIQSAMGWENDHLHAFIIDGESYGGRDPMGGELDSEDLDERRYRLDEVASDKAKFGYQYDFGDSWDHMIKVEKVIPSAEAAAKSLMAYTCLGGERACPPEDSGGVWGYYEKLETLKNPKNEYYEDIRDWMGDFDPEAFDVEKVNKRMKYLRKA